MSPDRPLSQDESRLLADLLARNQISPQGQRLQVERDRVRKMKVDELAEKMLGVRPEHGDTIYTQHPVMARVLRQALLEAFNGGVDFLAGTVLRAAAQGDRPGPNSA